MTAKVLLCALALAGLAGMFLGYGHQFGRLGRAGYALVSVGFLAMFVQSASSATTSRPSPTPSPSTSKHVLNGAMAHGASSGIGAIQGRLGVPLWVNLDVPLAMCGLVALAAVLPALRGGRMSATRALAMGRAPCTGRGYLAHRLL